MKIVHFLKKFSFSIIAILILQMPLSAQSLPDGVKALDNGLNEKARNIFAALIKADAKNAQALYYMGTAYCDADQHDSGKYFFNLGIAANPNEALNYVGLGRTLMDAGKSEEAKTNFEKALTLSQRKNIKVLLAVAEANVTELTKNGAYAVQVANIAKSIDPKNTDVLLTLGDAWLDNGDGGQALSNYETARDLNKNNPMAYYKIGKLYNRARNTEEAQTNFQKAIDLDKTFAPAYREIGTLYSRANKFTEAADYFKKYIGLVGNSVSERIRYATFLFLNKNYQGSIDEIESVRKRDTSNAVILRLLGYSYFELGDYKKAQSSMLNYFARMNPKKTITGDYDYMAKIYDKTGNDSLSILNYKKVLEMDTNRTDIYGTVAEKLLKAKKYKDAATYLNIKLAKGKGTTQDRYDLGKAYYNSKEYVLADSQLAKVNRAVPANVSVWRWRALTNASMDPDSKKGMAKPFYEGMIEKANADPAKYKDEILEGYNYLGYYYYIQKDNAKSREYCNKALELDPNNKAAKELIKYFNAKAQQQQQQQKGGAGKR